MGPLPPTYVKGFQNEDTSKLTYQQLGGTDLIVPKLAFGCSALGSVFRATDDGESVKVTENAIKEGLNLLDTAPWYGHGKSEQVLGKILPQLPRNTFYINTKVGRYERDCEKMFDFSAERVIKSVDESLNRLGLEYVDIIQVHDMEFAPSLDIIINETLPALQKVKESGKARYIGITGYPLENFRTVIERSAVKVDTVLTYCRGSMNDNSLQEFLPFLKSNGIGVINASPLSMGLLTNRGPADWHPANNKIKSVCKQAVSYCQNHDVDISRIATDFSLQQPDIQTTLFSSASMKNMASNLQVLREGITKKERQVQEEIMEQYFKPLNNANWEGVEVAKYREALSKVCAKDS